MCTIKIDDIVKGYLQKQNITVDYIPGRNERVQLCLASNVARGGNCLDVTDRVHDSIKQFAFNILAQLSGLVYMGIDLICKDVSKPLERQLYSVCELNCSPGLSLHTVPDNGIFRDAPGAIVDLIFNETSDE